MCAVNFEARECERGGTWGELEKIESVRCQDE